MPTSTPLTTARHQQPQDLTTPAAEILTAAFSNSIFLSYFLRSPGSSWPPGQIPGDLLQAHFQKIIPEKVRQGAEVVLAGSTCSEGSAEWVAAAAWYVHTCPVTMYHSFRSASLHTVLYCTLME